LRSPLHAIDGFSRVLQEDYGQQFDAEAKRVRGLTRGNSQKMAHLIDGLLAYSRIGCTHMNSAEVAMEALARATAGELDHAADARLTDTKTIKPIPPACGDRPLLHQMWINLLSNVFKFSGKASDHTVEVGGYVEGDKQVYHGTDNGAGLDMTYYDKLLGVFQRLHRAQDFPGIGVDHTVVQRMIERHQERI
jgi:light-regulated signal transduction histidine kinase (bacteriophytochrome)